jgi:competence protein ComEC
VGIPGSPGLLIDGGLANEYFDSGRGIVMPFLQWNGNRDLDGIMISHPEMDHMGGLLTVVGRVRPLKVWWNPVVVSSPHLDSIFAAAEAQGARIISADRTQAPVQFGSVTLRFLNPRFNMENEDAHHNSLNNASVVCKIEHGDLSFLFTGDLESEGEQELLASGLPLAASVLKVPHHGSKTSTTRAFLEAVRPKVAVISCEGPIYRSNPNRGVVERIEAAGAQVFITGRDGSVTVTSDGKDLDVKLGRPANKRRAIWAGTRNQ